MNLRIWCQHIYDIFRERPFRALYVEVALLCKRLCINLYPFQTFEGVEKSAFDSMLEVLKLFLC